MTRKSIVLIYSAILLGTVWSQPVVSAPPWSALQIFKRVEADPKKSYELTDRSGPWMVYAASFKGEKARDQALKLVHELRKDFKVPAYLYRQKFDYTQPIQGLGFDLVGETDVRPQIMKYQNGEEFEEYAVLVGDFESLEDEQLKKAMQSIKYARPKTLAGPNASSYHPLAAIKEVGRTKNKDEEKQKRGPMGTAFATRNPLLPEEYFKPKGPDRLIIQMNKDVEHSLLKNRGKFTVCVARFSGREIINPKESDSKKLKVSDTLNEAAEQANRLVKTLRKRGVEAYEYHDRTESLVTVGSFDSLGENTVDGQFIINPSLADVVSKFGAQSGGKKNTGIKPKVINGIALDPFPKPIEVPKVSIASAYMR